jgi:6,7-dimethyl-8-ribityllumazine synthase
MTHTRYAFIKAGWHSDIVDNSLKGFREECDGEVDVFDVPGAFEIPLMAQELAKTGKYSAVLGSAFIVDGGIYRHDFVSAAVVDGLMRVGLETGVPVLSVALTPHNFQETPDLINFFRDHFVAKGREAARAAKAILRARAAF